MAPKSKSAPDDQDKKMEKITNPGKMKPKRSRKRNRDVETKDKSHVGLFKEAKLKKNEAVFSGINDESLAEMGLSFLQDTSNDTPINSITSNVSLSFFHPNRSATILPQETCIVNYFCDQDENSVIQEQNCDNFSCIVDEIMLQIFKWLSKPTLIRCAQVCRRWQRLSFDESLWRRIDLGGRVVKSGVTGQVLNRGIQILRLAKTTIHSPALQNFESASCQLQYLDLSMSLINTSCLAKFLSVCFQLKKLSLEHCEINEEISTYIGQNSQLICLNLSMTRGLDKKGVVNILKGCQCIKELNVAWTNLDHSTLFMMASLIPESIQRLNISGFRNILTNDVVVNLMERCVNIEELDLSDSGLLTGVAIETILKLPRLKHLSLSRCYNISPIYFLSLRNLTSLTSLIIYGIFVDSALKTLQSSLPNIEINKTLFSTIARPTTGIRCTSIWGLRVRD